MNKIFTGFYVRPGTETLVATIASKSITTKDSKNFFTPAKRMCYTDDEFSPPFYNKVKMQKRFCFVEYKTSFHFLMYKYLKANKDANCRQLNNTI